jgi:hypothetical protein
MTDSIILYPVATTAQHVYVINIPSAESIMFAMLGIAIWYICVRGFAIGTFDKYITKQISEFDANLTIVASCMMLILPILSSVGLITMYNLITTMVDKGYYMPTIYDCWQFALIPPLYNILGYLFILLGIWCLINIIQMICLAIDDIEMWWRSVRY